MILAILLWIIAGLAVLTLLLTPLLIGRHREPLSPIAAVGSMAVNVAYVVILMIAAAELASA